MQGWKHWIPTQTKINYLQALLKVGFDTIDCGSFVSARAIPQMADTHQVLQAIDTSGSRSKLLAIVANVRGAQEAVLQPAIHYLGFPFSVSPTFQQLNANSTLADSFSRVQQVQELCIKNGKQLVVYISMGFGNPYGDAYDAQIVQYWVQKMIDEQVSIISLADTVGLATPAQVSALLQTLLPAYPATTIGVHLHSASSNWQQKATAALQAGCLRFDGALKGIGGCPMANNELVGNMDTEKMIPYFEQLGLLPNLDKNALEACSRMAASIFI
ncbi:MAG: hypothetical protein RL172_3138 [Bacteroidota bacterium]|jgi:hydroxymethylglutaryl-CoA lyase